MAQEVDRWYEELLAAVEQDNARIRRREISFGWIAGVCGFLTVGAIVVLSFPQRQLAVLDNVLLFLSPVWVLTGLIALVCGFGALIVATINGEERAPGKNETIEDGTNDFEPEPGPRQIEPSKR